MVTATVSLALIKNIIGGHWILGDFGVVTDKHLLVQGEPRVHPVGLRQPLVGTTWQRKNQKWCLSHKMSHFSQGIRSAVVNLWMIQINCVTGQLFGALQVAKPGLAGPSNVAWCLLFSLSGTSVAVAKPTKQMADVAPRTPLDNLSPTRQKFVGKFAGTILGFRLFPFSLLWDKSCFWNFLEAIILLFFSKLKITYNVWVA